MGWRQRVESGVRLLAGWRVGGLEGWRVEGLEGWRVGGLEGWRVGGLGLLDGEQVTGCGRDGELR